MSIVAIDETWFLAQLKPNSAQIAARNLGRQGFRTFLPMEEATQQRNSRFVTKVQPVFPGYIFVALDVAQGLWRKVNATTGVTKLVSFGTAPASVPNELVTELQARCDANGRYQQQKALQPGDQVTLTTGPFANAVAEIDQVAPDRRVWVLLEIMGRQTRVAVSERQLRAS